MTESGKMTLTNMTVTADLGGLLGTKTLTGCTGTGDAVFETETEKANPGASSIADDTHGILVTLDAILVQATSAAESLAKLAVDFGPALIASIGIKFGLPVLNKGNPQMAQLTPTIKLLKPLAPGKKMGVHGVAGVKALPGAFGILPGQSDSFTVVGLDAAGNPVDLSSVASLSNLVSENTAILTVDPAVGMTSTCHTITTAPGGVPAVGSTDVDATATWTDGSDGPFSIVQPVVVAVGPAGSLGIQFGTPVITPA
jgi:hypothetical protein